jgi:predicted O-methyltransferase YrrM
MKEFESYYKNDLEEKINTELISRPSSIFIEMEEFAKKEKIPILSPSTGSILNFLIKIINSKKILELGTGLGYSAAWILFSNSSIELDTIDRNLRELKRAEFFLEKLKLENKVNFIRAHCLEYIEKMENLHKYDTIFIDCDKICYPDLIDIFLKKTRPNTHLIFDNVLWHGRLFEEEFNKPSDIAMKEFWKKVKSNFSYQLFTNGDGLLLTQT